MIDRSIVTGFKRRKSNATVSKIIMIKLPDLEAWAVPAPLRVNNAKALMPVLLAGLGLALQPEFLVWEQLQSGKLEQVMSEWVSPPIALHILTSPHRARPKRVELLIDYLAHCFVNAPWAQPMQVDRRR